MEAGHGFTPVLGEDKTPPEVSGNQWLLSVGITPETQIPELACNIGTTTVELVKRFRLMRQR